MTEMRVDVTSGLLSGVPFHPSPHHDVRPQACPIDLVVIHGISLPPNEFGGPWVDQLFLGQLDPQAHPYFMRIAGLRVSSHLLIDRHGQLTQYVPFHLRAWHAGVSQFCGRDNCNDFSIGIELEGSDHTPYSEAQYQRLSETLDALRHAYPTIAADRIVGHADIAPGRKTDPGPLFDWERLGLFNSSSGTQKG